MYNISNRYKTAYEKDTKAFDVMGTIGTYDFWADNIIEGSLKIIQQCSSKSEVQIGSVFTSVFYATFTGLSIPRNSWKGKEISIQEGLGIQTGSITEFEYIPLGVYTIREAEHTTAGVVVKAYDNMVKFDKGFRLKGTTGTAYQILSLACRNCGVTLGMRSSDFSSFANGARNLSLYNQNDIETYRDLVSWIAQTLGAFAYIDRTGNLMLKNYKDVQDVDYQLDKFKRHTSGAVSDYTTYYTGISVVDIAKEETKYYGLSIDDGLTYNLGSNPFMQVTNEEVRTAMMIEILSKLHAIEYAPFEFRGLFGGVFDLGDVIEFVDGIGINSIGCINYIEYGLNTPVRLCGYGADPSLASAKSKTDKNISGLMKKEQSNSVYFYNFLNAEGYTISSTLQNIASIIYSTVKACDVVFQGEILCQSTANTIVEVTYLIDGVEESYHPTETWSEAGKHIISLMYYMANGENEGHQFSVSIKCLQGSIEILPNEARFMIWGQGLAAKQDWDGRINIKENIGLIDINDSINVETFSYTVDVNIQVPISEAFTENVGLIDINDSIDVEEFNAVMFMNKTPLHNQTWGETLDETWSNVYDNHLW